MLTKTAHCSKIETGGAILIGFFASDLPFHSSHEKKIKKFCVELHITLVCKLSATEHYRLYLSFYVISKHSSLAYKSEISTDLMSNSYELKQL